MSSSEAFILNTIQTPASLLPVYRSIDDGHSTKEAITEDTGIESGLDETLKGLQLLRMIGREESQYYASDYQWDVNDEEWNFKLSALHNLAQETDPRDWGRQAVVLLNYAYLLEHNQQYFANNQESLYIEMDDWHRDKGYEPHSSVGVITHNDPKFGNWTRLVRFLGLAHKVSGRNHTVYPRPGLVGISLELAVEDVGTEIDGAPGIETQRYLQWLRDNLLYITTTQDGMIPAPFARILYELVCQDAIELIEYGDAGMVELDGVPPHENIDSETNAIILTNDEH
mgnify:CR=1 FL=1